MLSNVYQAGATDVSVIGAVGGESLKRWSLDYGSGASPSSWTTIATGTTRVSNAALGTWQTGSLANGTYTVRLQVWDKAGTRSVVTNTVTLANFTISQNVLQLDGSSGGTVTYTSVVPFSMTEKLVVKDAAGRLVRRLVEGHRLAGTYADSWDGRDDGGDLVPDGPYFYVATVDDGTHSMTWDLSDQYLNNYFDSKDALRIVPFDPFNNRPLTFAYDTPVAALVTISVFSGRLTSNDCDQPVEKVLCLVTRRYQEAGAHTFSWAGVDSKGIYRADQYSFVSVTTVRDRFSKNAVVVHGTKPSVHNIAITPSAFAPGTASPDVSFELQTFKGQPADVTIMFLNQASLSTLRTIRLPAQSPGFISVPWDVRADNGAFVAPGAYTITVKVKDNIGNVVQGQILATVWR
jgi:flagellar hook assembly protein FlgD